MRIETNRAWTVAELLAAISETAPETVLVFGKTLKADVRGDGCSRTLLRTACFENLHENGCLD